MVPGEPHVTEPLADGVKTLASGRAPIAAPVDRRTGVPSGFQELHGFRSPTGLRAEVDDHHPVLVVLDEVSDLIEQRNFSARLNGQRKTSTGPAFEAVHLLVDLAEPTGVADIVGHEEQVAHSPPIGSPRAKRRVPFDLALEQPPE
ncbi:MAG: hypothetical protein R3E97_20950 [Candidatus Eisenbacteria bacterium]